MEGVFAEFDDSSHALCFCSNAGLFEWTLVGNTFKMGFLATRFVCACFDRKNKHENNKHFRLQIADCKLPISNIIYNKNKTITCLCNVLRFSTVVK